VRLGVPATREAHSGAMWRMMLPGGSWRVAVDPLTIGHRRRGGRV